MTLTRWWKRLFLICEHEWEIVAEGRYGVIHANHGYRETSNGHWKDFLCKKCKKAKRSEWKP